MEEIQTDTQPTPETQGIDVNELLSAPSNEAKEPAQEQPQPQEEATENSQEGAQEEAGVENIFETEGEEEESSEDTQEGEEEGELDEASFNTSWDAYEGEFSKNIPDITVGKDAYGNDVVLHSDDIKAVTKVLKDAGVDPSETPTIARCYAAIEGKRLAEQNAREKTLLSNMATECRQTFGDDLKRVVGNARKAMAMMDPDLAQRLQSQPIFMNNAQVLQFLSEVGERLGNDTGTRGSSASANISRGFDVSQLLPSGNR